ncbi:hypothetical protein POTOM_056293 [Populus tomentosa]|uniref:WAT1-related protein n=1 Tax=Populus tomentosa TaxID=118781 RepID=A0A8X8C2T4_POPTO|nr:hypothetical protein POTOM_056293 [Populus tomentosa]
MSMALLKGPKLLNTELLPIKSSSTGSGSKTWLLGSIILFGNSCSIVIWKIVQVPISARCPDPLLYCLDVFLRIPTTIAITIFIKPDPQAWKPPSILEHALNCFCKHHYFSNLVRCTKGTTLLSNVQTSATVIGTVLAATFLHEVIYTSSLLVAIVVISGLYMVISGQASDQQEIKQETNFVPQADGTNIQQGSMDESSGHNICKKTFGSATSI